MTPDELKELERAEAEIAEYERTHFDPAREAAEDAEHAKFQELYPGEFVVYLDSWDGTVLTRQVLAHDADMSKIIKIADTWPVETQDAARIDYLDPILPPPAILPRPNFPRATA